MSLDQADQRILTALIENARISITDLAKKTGLTREVVNYRIQKLEKSNIIKGYLAIIHQPFFCQGVAQLLLKLKRSSETEYNKVLQTITKNEATNWIAELCGEYDLAITIPYKDPKQLAQTIAEITQTAKNILIEHNVLYYIDEYKFSRKGTVTEKPEEYDKENTISFEATEKPKLDKTDITILKELAKNCRTKNIEIAKKAKVSEDTIRTRINKLEQKGIIRGYTLAIDTNNLNYESYYLALKAQTLSEEIVNKIKYYAQTNPYITFCSRITGKNNILLTLVAKNRTHFNELFLKIRTTLGEDITDYQFHMLLKELKEIYIPIKSLEN